MLRSTLVVVGLALAGCSYGPKPLPRLPKPAVETGHELFAGTVLSGQRPSSSADWKSAQFVRCRILHRRQLQRDGLLKLAGHTRLVVAGRSGAPLQPATEIAADALTAHGEAAANYLAGLSYAHSESIEVARFDAAVPVGTTVSCHMSEIGWDDRPRRRVVVLLSRQSADAPVAVALQIDTLLGEDPERLEHRELVLLEDAPELDGAPLILGFGSPFHVAQSQDFLIELRLQNDLANAEERQAAITSGQASLAATTEAAAKSAAPITAATAAAMTLGTTLRNDALSRGHRPSLVFLAASTEAPLALELAMGAPQALLTEWAAKVKDIPADTDPAWRLERSAFELLATRLDKGTLEPALQALLVRHSGEAGRFPGSISAMLPKCGSCADLHGRLRDENIEFLAANSPAGRVRAFDWLADRGLAPKGFDPLADRDSRRKVLKALEQAREAEQKGGKK